MTTPRSPRAEAERNERGSSYDRRARRRWLLAAFGDGETAPCALRIDPACLVRVDATTLTVDRIHPGAFGGRYVHGNIQPACAACNRTKGSSQ